MTFDNREYLKLKVNREVAISHFNFLLLVSTHFIKLFLIFF
jgi:hypothetical protein